MVHKEVYCEAPITAGKVPKSNGSGWYWEKAGQIVTHVVKISLWAAFFILLTRGLVVKSAPIIQITGAPMKSLTLGT